MTDFRIPLFFKQAIFALILTVGSVAVFAYFAFDALRAQSLQEVLITDQVSANQVVQSLRLELDRLKREREQILALMQSHGGDATSTAAIQQIFTSNPKWVAMAVKVEGAPSVLPQKKTSPFAYLILNNAYLSSNDIRSDDLIGELSEMMEHYLPSSNLVSGPHSLLLTVEASPKAKYIFAFSRDFMFRLLDAGPRAERYLISETGELLANSVTQPSKVNWLDHPVFRDLLKSGGDSKSGTFDWGTARLSYAGNAERVTPSLFVISQFNQESVFASLVPLKQKTLPYLLLASAVALLAAALLTRHIKKPIKIIMKATEDFAAGNYRTRFNISTRDEIEELSKSVAMLGLRLEERDRELEKTTELAIRDSVTGLFNSRHFHERLADAYEVAKRHGQSLSILMIDVDKFKAFNDEHGHKQGDELLKQMTRVLQASMRKTDLIARFGGEEFSILMPQTDHRGALDLAERVRLNFRNLRIPNLKGEAPLKATCSIGVSSLDIKTLASHEVLLNTALENLLKAKKLGRDQVV